MSTTQKYPTVLAESGAGTAWTNLSNAAGTPGGSNATLGADGAAKQVDLTSASLAFAIPAGATINGILINAEMGIVSEGGETFALSVLVKKNGTTTETKTQTGILVNPSFYGSATDTWSSVWTANDINANLTVHLAATLGTGARLVFGFAGVGVTVYYTVNGRTARTTRIFRINRV